MASTSKILLCTLLVGCGAAPAPEPMPPPPAPPAPAAATVAVDPAPPPRDDGRLPSGVKPSRYVLDLTIDPVKTTFSGRVRIGVVVDQPTRAVVLHGRGMTVRSAVISSSRGKLAAKATLRMAARGRGDPEELVLALDEPVPAGEAEIGIEYDAPFADGLRGLYRADDGGVSYAYTQFEPNDARRAFPCFDEPANKTPFEITITAPKGLVAFANTREAHRREGGDLVTFEFEKSRPLPTYLVAFGVGPLDVLEGPRQPTTVRLVSVKGKSTLGKLSVDAAAAHLDLLGKYFDRPYPYPKLDVVAVPNFGAGAMENPGFVTFREELVLLDPEHVSTMARRSMASVMAHELAHQWFGDLVTMQWWDDLWLNEAFATWMSDKIVDQWRPETRARVLAVGAKSAVMEEDALASTRKIRNPVRSTSEAEEAFDGITYQKGRAVLNMTEAWLGEDAFREGMRRYVKKHEWGNATAADLYASLAEASGGREVAKVMDSFTDQTGVPLVTASLQCPAGGASYVQLKQQEYRTLERRGQGDKLWRIPLCVVYDAGAKIDKQCTLLESAEGRVELGKGRCPAFFYPNAGEVGYFRVGFERTDVNKLARSSLGKLSEQERFGLVSNSWAAVWSGDLAVSDYVELLRNFKKETSKLVWGQIVESLAGIDRSVVSDASRPAFAKIVRDLLGPTAHRLGWTAKKGEPDEQKLLREAVLGTLGFLGSDDWALSEGKRVADAWLSDPMKVDADLARIAVPLAARRGDAALFDRLLGVLKNPKTPEIRLLALSGLTAFEDSKLVERTLGLTLDRTIKTQDVRYVFGPLGTRRPTRDVTYTWIEKHFDELTKVVPAFIRARLVHVAGAMCEKDRVRAVESFLRPRVEKLEGAEKATKQAIEEGLRCAALAEKEGPATTAWLSSSDREAKRTPAP